MHNIQIYLYFAYSILILDCSELHLSLERLIQRSLQNNFDFNIMLYIIQHNWYWIWCPKLNQFDDWNLDCSIPKAFTKGIFKFYGLYKKVFFGISLILCSTTLWRPTIFMVTRPHISHPSLTCAVSGLYACCFSNSACWASNSFRRLNRARTLGCRRSCLPSSSFDPVITHWFRSLTDSSLWISESCELREN